MTQLPYGKLQILTLEAILKKTAQLLKELNQNASEPISIGLTGGSTPKAFYHWVVDNQILNAGDLAQCRWFTSDERYVPLDSEDSNMGNADRMLLGPLNIPAEHKYPWPTDFTPKEAAERFNQSWNQLFDAKQCFDVCFLGMGDDGHTASWFPGSPLVENTVEENFISVSVLGKGERFTVTPAGLNRCKRIVMTVTGKGKAERLKQVFEGEYDPLNQPVQLLKACADKVTWWVDEDAAGLLG